MTALFVSGAIIIGALLLYRRSLHHALLRAFAVIFLYLIITGFSVPVKTPETHNPPLLLVDASQSMESHFPDIITLLDTLSSNHTTLYFSEKQRAPVIDSISQYGRYTDIIGILASVTSLNPEAILLVSDGNHNYQGTTLSDLDDFPVPVYAFGVGTQSTQDVELVEVSYPDYIHIGDSITVKAIVQSYGYEQGMATAKLVFKHSQKTIPRSFSLSKTKAKNTLVFRTAITHPEDTVARLTIAPSFKEATLENNSRRCTFIPIKRTIRVVYYTEHVSFNSKFITQALTQSKRFEVSFIARSVSGQYIELRTKEPRTLPSLDTIDALILDNVSCSTLPWPQLRDAVKSGLGLLCLGTLQQLTPGWREMLPIRIAESVTAVRAPLAITKGFSCLTEDKTYPPFSHIQRVLSVQQNAITIGIINNMPVVAYQRYGQGMVFQINCIALGTWHFMQKGMHQQDILSCLMPDILRFVAHEGRNKRLILSIPRQTVSVGERVDLHLQSYDRDFRQQGGGTFFIEINDRKLPFFETSQGIYHSSFIPEKQGTISLAASGMLHSESLSSNNITLRVNKGNLEHVQTLNQKFLQSVAQRTGGIFSPVESLPGFDVPDPAPTYHVTYIDLNNPFGYLLIIILLAADWVLRRRKGTV